MSNCELFPNNSVTCISPWYNLRINHNGSYSYCDHALLRSQSKQLPSQWFSLGPDIINVRKDIQQGVPVHSCSNCYKQEQNKISGDRHRHNLQAAIYPGPYFSESLAQSPARGRMSNTVLNEQKPSFLHVSLNNICNLACRMCSANSSTKLGTVLVKANLLPKSTKILQDWTNTGGPWDDFCENLVLNNSNLICLHFMGGEPMVNEKFFEILQRCVDRNRTDFHLTFVTNGTIWDDSYIDLFSKFKSVVIEVSIENFHPANDYIRVGSDYKKIQSNIESMLKFKTESISIVLRTVPQAMSIIHYDSVFDFALLHGLNIDYNVLLNHTKLEISVLPSSLRQSLVKKWITKYSHLLNNDTNNISNIVNQRSVSQYRYQISAQIKELISVLDRPSPENLAQLQKEFIEYNVTLDSVTGLEFRNFFPELLEIYEKYNRI